MAEIVLKLPKSVMLLKECLGNLLSFSYHIILSLISRRALTNQFFLTLYYQSENMYLYLCEYSEINHTSTSMIFFIKVHMLKHIQQ